MSPTRIRQSWSSCLEPSPGPHAFRSRAPRAWFAAAAIVLGLGTVLALPARAAVPPSTMLDGALVSAGGAPAADGDYAITFAVYPAATGGTASWTEGPVNIAIKGGRFSWALGSKTPLDAAQLAGLAEAWLGLQVGSDPELPRQRLHAAPYALAAATAAGLSCTGCLGGNHMADGGIAAAKVGFNYAGSATKGGAALDLSCTGCVAVAELTFDGDIDLAGNSLKAKNGTFSGDVVAKTVTANGFVGDGSKLTGIKTASGSCSKPGEVVKGINADGTLACVAAMDPSALPPDGLDEISNGLLSNQFVDTIAAKDTNVAIPDNTGADAVSDLIFPDIGVAQSIEVTIELSNTDLSTVAVTLLPPDDKKVGYTICDPCGDKDAKAYKVTLPPTKPKAGDIQTWVGTNPKGTWTLKVKDTSYCLPQAPGNAGICDVANKADGEIVTWSIKIKTLSNQKVAASGQLLVGKAIQVGSDSTPCTAATAGMIRWNGTSFQGCNGKKYYDIKLYVGPGSKEAPAGLSCLDIKETAKDALDGIYWIDPDGGDAANSFQVYCDMTSHGGGWTLVLNLDTNDGANRHYFDTDFWTGTKLVGVVASALQNDFKSEAFNLLAAKEMMISAHREGAKEGTAYYAFESGSTGKTMQALLSTVSNKTVTGNRLGQSGSVGAAGRLRNAGDAFIDNAHPVIFNSTYQPLDAENFTRIGTNYGSVCGTINCNGHNYGGLGGRHYRSSWGVYYEAAQLNGYCETQGLYGSDHAAYNGNDAGTGCTYVARDMDIAVWVR